MPQILDQPVDLFTTPVAPTGALLPRQVDPALPVAAVLDSATSMLLPQLDLARQLAHFPANLYDLRPESHLVRFMTALLGDAGAGQLRKRQLVARMAATLTGSGWLDQDRFYGAIFSMGRTLSERLAIDPAADTATADEWEALEAADAAYRERIITLAATLPMAGTLPGLVAAAGAIIGSPVEATETWRLLDGATASPPRTWAQVAALGGWGALDGLHWFSIENFFTIGLSGVNSRAEVVLRPHKTYTPDRAGQVAAASDARALIEILSKITPDGILITVDTAVAAPGVAVPTAAVWSDSNHTATVPVVTPLPSLSDATVAAVYPLSKKQAADGDDPRAPRDLPLPQGIRPPTASWDFNASITAITSYAFTAGVDVGLDVPDDGTPIGPDNEQVTWRDGTSTTYAAAGGTAPPTLAAAARLGSPGTLIAHPYSGARKTVPTHV